MRILGILLISALFLIFWGGCTPKTHAWIDQEPGRSILDLEYINDTLGIRLRDIRSVQRENETFDIQVYLEAEDTVRYGQGHHFYLHFYEKPGPERGGQFTGTIAGDPYIKNDILIFKGTLQSAGGAYPLLRYGLVNPEKTRLFTLSVDTTEIALK